MSDEIRVSNRPQMQQAPQGMGMQQEPQQRNSKAPWIILLVVIVVVVILGVLFRGQLFGKNGSSSMMSSSDPAMANASGYQAVFLTNGQVYFGKMSNQNSDYPMLTDIYYLQVVQQPPLQGTPQAGQQTAQSQQSISLVKLGNELHGPVDEMHIAKNQILFYEDMKTDSQVVKAIQAYKANPTGATPTPTPSH